MTKKTVNVINQKPPMPFVSVCTPTFNRRPFIPIMFECFRNQKYPKHRLEWIIIDDGTDKIKDLIDEAKIPQIKYYSVDKKMTLGAKRNMMHDKSKGSIIVYMDDDDYYPPERISHAVEVLQANPKTLCAGSSEIYLYYKHIQKMYQFGPYNSNHATAATFAFRRELLNISRYNDNACLAEEREFLKEYTIPFVQLDPIKTILVFSHDHNSFDKKYLLKQPHPNFVKESTKTVDIFIRNLNEANIKKFFMEDIDVLLANYSPGVPAMKPDVLKQMKEIDEERQKQAQQMMQQGQHPSEIQPQIMMQEPGKEPIPIGIIDAVNIINKQQQQLQQDAARIKELEEKILSLESKYEVRNNSSLSKSVSFIEGESIVLAKGKAELSEVIKLKERIQELENQIKKSKNSFIDAIRNESIIKGKDEQIIGIDSINKFKNNETTPQINKNKPVSKLEPEVNINNMNQSSTTKFNKPVSKLEPEININNMNQSSTTKFNKPVSKLEPEVNINNIFKTPSNFSSTRTNLSFIEKSKVEPDINIKFRLVPQGGGGDVNIYN